MTRRDELDIKVGDCEAEVFESQGGQQQAVHNDAIYQSINFSFPRLRRNSFDRDFSPNTARAFMSISNRLIYEC